MFRRCTEKHSTVAKVRKLEKFCSELGLSLYVGYGGQIEISDTDRPGITFEYRDIEQSGGSYQTTGQFPHELETMLVFQENEEDEDA